MTINCQALLQKRFSKVRNRRFVKLFDCDRRMENFSAEACGLFLDISKTNIDVMTKGLLFDWVEESGFYQKRYDLFAGVKINYSEDRSATHCALRSTGSQLLIDGQNIMSGIGHTLLRMKSFSEEIRSGKVCSVSGSKFTDILCLGIGGSSVGPKMAFCALAPFKSGPNCHFVSNVDSADLVDTMKQLKAEKTLIVVASKTFKTVETMRNAKAAISWLKVGIGDSVKDHLVAITSNIMEAKKYGVEEKKIFSFPDSVGGRYSIWGPIGLPLLLSVGTDNFDAFLSGAERMDQHFQTQDFNKNLPVLLGIVGLWHRNFCSYSSRAILPYEHRLKDLPLYLQQLDMESNGKSVKVTGEDITYETSPIVWGNAGTDGQHAFFQMLHQGTSIVPCEFIIGAKGFELAMAEHHELLVANCLAQSEALMTGRSYDQTSLLGKSKSCQGNRPSVTILYEKLSPEILGSLLSLYEHRTFVEGVVWSVNSFDQWGVELGKEIANNLFDVIRTNGDFKEFNASTEVLAKKIQNYKN